MTILMMVLMMIDDDDVDDDDVDGDDDDDDIFFRLTDFSLLDGQYMMYIILIHLNLTCQNLSCHILV